MPSQTQREENDAGYIEYLPLAAPATALICVAILYHSAATESWSRMVAEWLRAARRRMLIGAACLAAPFIIATLGAWHNSFF